MTDDQALGKRERWGPELDDPGMRAFTLDGWGPDLVARVKKVEAELGIPVQALRGDRVLSFKHLLMAFEHQSRAHTSGRSGPQDAGVGFLRFMAAEKQITKALQAMGVPLGGDEHPPVLLVALGPVEPHPFRAAVASAGLNIDEEVGSGMPVRDAARRYWDARFSLPGQCSDTDREARLFAAMALLALEA